MFTWQLLKLLTAVISAVCGDSGTSCSELQLDAEEPVKQRQHYRYSNDKTCNVLHMGGGLTYGNVIGHINEVTLC